MYQTKRHSGISVVKLIFAALFVMLMTNSGFSKTRDYYQIQVYKLTGKVQEEKVDNFLKNAYLPALHRAGIKTVGVFKPVETDTLSGKRVFVWIPFTSLDHFAKTLEALQKDQEYQKTGIDFLGAPFNQAPFVRKESILLRAFHLIPNFTIPSFPTPHAQRIYELRSYEGGTENLYRKKVEMFNEGGEWAIFKNLGFNALFYAEVISGSTMPNLMYMTTFADLASRTAHWSAFSAHPNWKKISGMAEYKNTVSKSVILFLHPTDYSDF
ncbi:MAG TPA: NIPSNAP family protein [Prolixibacteraceae bacterium]